MNLPSKIISTAVITLAVGLSTACWPFSDDSTPDSNNERRNMSAGQTIQPTADDVAKSKANQNAVNQPPTPAPTPARQGSRMPDDEQIRRCQFWALNNLDPLRYSAFEKLNPSTMDDLDRILWRQVIGSSSTGYYSSQTGEPADAMLRFGSPYMKYCMAYWTEPLDDNNAALRNVQFEYECRTQLQKGIVDGYRRLTSMTSCEDDGTEQIYRTPNHYVRILQWVNMTGPELAASQKPPYEILRQQSRNPSAYLDKWILDDDDARDYMLEHGERPDPDLVGIVRAAGLNGSGGGSIKACHQYSRRSSTGIGYHTTNLETATRVTRNLNTLGTTCPRAPSTCPSQRRKGKSQQATP